MDFNPFDVATKELVWEGPVACLERFGIAATGPVEVIDSDITTLTAAADKVIRVPGPEPYLVNIELQSYHDTSLARTLWFRQAALDYRHDLPVLTVLVLLCKEANISPEPPPLAAKLWTATCLLMGLRFSSELTTSLLEGVQIMHQSTTYEKILNDGREEGRIREARRMLRLMGTKRFGEPEPATAAALEAIQDVARLEALGERILEPEIETWEGLLQGS